MLVKGNSEKKGKKLRQNRYRIFERHGRHIDVYDTFEVRFSSMKRTSHTILVTKPF